MKEAQQQLLSEHLERMQANAMKLSEQMEQNLRIAELNSR